MITLNRKARTGMLLLFFLKITVLFLSTSTTVTAFQFLPIQQQRSHPSKLYSTSKSDVFFPVTTVVDKLLLEVTDNQDKEQDSNTRDVIQNLIWSLSNTSTSTSTHTNSTEESIFEPILGYYNVSYTLTARPKDNPVGGKWTRLWKVRRMLQHVLPTNNRTITTTATKVVAQVVNAIRIELLWGMIGIWVLLRGDAIPLKEDQEASSSDSTTNTLNLLPNLSDRTVKVYFDKPRIGLSLYKPVSKKMSNGYPLFQRVLSLGPTSSVVLDTPYVDNRLRLGKGGVSGSQFVFARVQEDDVEAKEGWKWVLEKDATDRKSVLSQKQLMTLFGIWCAVSSIAFAVFQQRIIKLIASGSIVASVFTFLWLSFSTGGIETRGDTYIPGR
jgi:hypothetical protein